MTAAILTGASSGALHAVTGPDHVLSLGPVALSRPGSSARVGLVWGAGHALGTLLLCLPLLLLARVVHLPGIAAWGERVAGLVLLATAAWSWRSTYQPPARAAPSTGAVRAPLLVGVLHGASGAGALVMLLPAVLGADLARAAAFLAAFSLGSALAMSGLTAAIGRLGTRLTQARTKELQRALLIVTALLGAFWLLG